MSLVRSQASEPLPASPQGEGAPLLTENKEGSIPSLAAICVVRSAARTPGLHPGYRRFESFTTHQGKLAQLEEHLYDMQKVVGSCPTLPTSLSQKVYSFCNKIVENKL